MINLIFGKGSNNSKLKKLQEKLKKKVYTFSLMSGHNCPYAKDCLSKAVIGLDGKWHIQDGPHTDFRCFSASEEALYPGVRQSRIQNSQLLEVAARDKNKAKENIVACLPGDAEIIRVHVGGDFATQNYFDSWLDVARECPHIIFYAYTKSIPFWVKRLGDIPANFSLTASKGGWKDDLIDKYKLKSAVVVESVAAARKLGLVVDTDDSHAVKNNGKSFALVIHGTQPAGSKWGKFVQKGKK